VAELIWFVALGDPALADVVDRVRRTLDAAGLHDAGNLDRPGGDRTRQPTAGSVVDAPDDSHEGPCAIVVWTDRPLPPTVAERLAAPGCPVVLAGPSLEALRDHPLAAASGVRPGRPSAVHDARLRAGVNGAALRPYLTDHAHAGSAHLGHHTHVHDRVLAVDHVAPDVQVLLAARLGMTDHPVACWRPSTGVLTWTVGSTPEAAGARGAVRMLVLAARHMLALPTPPPVRVGLLGYGMIGHEHSRAVRAVPGLELAAVCDASPERRDAARRYSPGVRTCRDADDLVEDDGVDLVIVSTPPVSHARWARAALKAGRHVVVEKPFAITTDEADEVLALAAEQDRLALVYQNRRFDPDHLAVRRAVRDGRVGELFHLETFVGGYGHPCNLWHSDAGVSGGAFFDWGAHVLDQVLDLVDEPVDQVTAVEHKRVWLDVTNADHSRVTMRFSSGAEAMFVYSDLAAALKPRWYLLGTGGAIVGSWRFERVIARSDIGTLAEDVLAPADSPPLLDLHAPDGSVTRLATPPGAPHRFHAELADAVRFGLPATVTGAQSRRVLSVMEAARLSARDGGRPVRPR
jgi:predicted dehydrogenase